MQDTRKEHSERPRVTEDQKNHKKAWYLFPIRKPNSYKRMMKATREHSVLTDSFNRQFKQNIPAKVLLTDITYLFYGDGKKAYLSTIKDGSTNEILAHSLSESLGLDIAIDTIHKLMKDTDITCQKAHLSAQIKGFTIRVRNFKS